MRAGKEGTDARKRKAEDGEGIGILSDVCDREAAITTAQPFLMNTLVALRGIPQILALGSPAPRRA